MNSLSIIFKETNTDLQIYFHSDSNKNMNFPQVSVKFAPHPEKNMHLKLIYKLKINTLSNEHYKEGFSGE